jgi:putative ABC transport system substrate-binding protein
MQFGQLKRREVISLLGGAAAWPIAAHAQQPALPVVAFLHPGAPEIAARDVAAFRKGLNEVGYIKGRTSPSSITGWKVNMIYCRHCSPIWSAAL